MADKTVRIENMPKPDGSGTPERVAWDMVVYLRNLITEKGDADTRRKAYLDFYAECLEATKGQRGYDPVKSLIG